MRALLTRFPDPVLAAAVLAAEGVSFLLAGSAALWLRREIATDCLIGRGRQDWERLRHGAGFLPVADVAVLVASSADAWDLRRRYKERA
jgi:hypothetical protein